MRGKIDKSYYEKKLYYTPISPFSKKIIIDVDLKYSDKKDFDLFRLLRLLPFFLRPNKEWLFFETIREIIISNVIENFFNYYFYYIIKFLSNDSNYLNRVYKNFLNELNNIPTIITSLKYEYRIDGIKDIHKNFDKFTYIVVFGRYRVDKNKIFINYELLTDVLNVPKYLIHIRDIQELYNELKREISKRTDLAEYLDGEALIKLIRTWSHEFVHALQFMFYNILKNTNQYHNTLNRKFLDEDEIEHAAIKISKNITRKLNIETINKILFYLYDT